MRIQQKVSIDKPFLPEKQLLAPKSSAKKSATFKEELQEFQKKQLSFKLKNLLAKIDEEADRLIKERTVTILSQYKRLIKDFLEEVLKNLYLLKEERNFDSKGKQKVFILIKTANKSLEDLVKLVLNKQTTNLKLLEKLGEIKGILIDLYS